MLNELIYNEVNFLGIFSVKFYFILQLTGLSGCLSPSAYFISTCVVRDFNNLKTVQVALEKREAGYKSLFQGCSAHTIERTERKFLTMLIPLIVSSLGGGVPRSVYTSWDTLQYFPKGLQ